MCGINGFLYFDPQRPAQPELVHRMREIARHRGPDDSGFLCDGPAGLGFNRLSIIDLAGGHQPMSNEDGTVWIVFNGEIYNFQELRQDLLARGHRFTTQSDTETIVHAWEEFGADCVTRLRGMFAFAIWDRRRRTLFCARDRLGIKPFFYYRDAQAFVFASEMKQLFAWPDIPREVDEAALAEFLRRRYVIAPRTMARHICKLPPAHTLTVTAEGVKTERYWDLPLAPPRERSDGEALEEFQALLSATVRQHLISDVPLGAFLSGGLDSSSVVAFMAGLGVPRIKTFSIGYDSPESELPYARKVAAIFGTEHHELCLTAADFSGMLPRIVWHMDEPVADEAALPLYFVARLARQSVTVALSGEGSDEVFSGYPIYRVQQALGALNRMPLARLAGGLLERAAPNAKLRKYARQLGRPLEERYGGVGTSFPEDALRRLFPRQAAADPDPVREAYARCAGLPALNRMGYVDVTTWLPSNLLVKADRMSMANSLELRVPFLDHKVVEFGFGLPPRLKVRGNHGKWILKRAMAARLPHEIIYRPKMGFPVPTRRWFKEDLAGFARETLLGKGGATEAFFSPAAVAATLAAPESRDQSGQIYSLLVFDQWYRCFIGRQTP